jgi:hypothetical protein
MALTDPRATSRYRWLPRGRLYRAVHVAHEPSVGLLEPNERVLSTSAGSCVSTIYQRRVQYPSADATSADSNTLRRA